MEWVRQEKERHGRIALVAETAADARDVLVEGPSGLKAIAPPWDRPKYEPSKRRVTWDNGAIAICYNATEPDMLRGPEHEIAVCDELAKWKYAQECWDMLQFGLRKGPWPRTMITTTPRPIATLKAIMKDQSTVTVRGSTYDNRDNLSPDFLHDLRRYEGTRLGRQELHAELLEDVDGALWSHELLEMVRVDPSKVPDMKRVVVGVDPSGTSTNGAMQGIVVCGLGMNGLFYVLADHSCSESPAGWGYKAARAFYMHAADAIVVERNYGGDMVKSVIQAQARNIPVRTVVATRGKHIRAEPIAAMYEQWRVRHAGLFPQLEEQMTQMSHEGYQGAGSPDRLDACVWALHELSAPRSSIGVINGARY
jgi:phage terminase large subunit-like protein